MTWAFGARIPAVRHAFLFNSINLPFLYTRGHFSGRRFFSLSCKLSGWYLYTKRKECLASYFHWNQYTFFSNPVVVLSLFFFFFFSCFTRWPHDFVGYLTSSETLLWSTASFSWLQQWTPAQPYRLYRPQGVQAPDYSASARTRELVW